MKKLLLLFVLSVGCLVACVKPKNIFKDVLKVQNACPVIGWLLYPSDDSSRIYISCYRYGSSPSNMTYMSYLPNDTVEVYPTAPGWYPYKLVLHYSVTGDSLRMFSVISGLYYNYVKI